MIAAMIARLWHGATTAANAEAYQALLRDEVFPRIPHMIESGGFHGAYLLRREVPEGFEFVTLLFFDSIEDVKAFAGEEYERAYISPEAYRLLSRFDRRAAHYETLIDPPTT
jgi:hypothetical protein